ncbi:MAG: hypothetical protein ABIP60_04480 [Novosphingobium sp.]
MTIYLDWAGAENGSRNARAVARYNRLMQQLADRSKQTGFEKTAWHELEEVVSAAEFRRFGNFLDVQDWREYVDLLHNWAPTSKSFLTNFRRMTDHENLVFVELEEIHDKGPINSVAVYEFNDAGKIVRLHIYLQMPRGG